MFDGARPCHRHNYINSSGHNDGGRNVGGHFVGDHNIGEQKDEPYHIDYS